MPRNSKNGGGALSVTPVRATVCESEIWCLLNNFNKDNIDSIQIWYADNCLTYSNIKTQVKFDLGYNPLFFMKLWAF